MKKLKIGIVGCGAIGSSLAKVVARDLRSEAALCALYDIDEPKARKLSEATVKNISCGFDALIRKSDLVIEAASAKCSWMVAKKALENGRDVMIMSVGGVLDHAKDLARLALTHKARVYIPSGAISGVDALKASGVGSISKVMITTRKHPLSFQNVEYLKDKGLRPEKIRKDTVLFSGPAKDAVKYFPQNINVAAVLSLAGIGSHKTQVRIIASPSAKRNIHEIEIISDAGRVFTRTENVLHPDNPKTSYLAVLSAIATLKAIVRPVSVGT